MPPRFLCEVISIFSIKIWYCKICKKCYQITNIQKINLFFGCFLKTIGASNWCETQKKSYTHTYITLIYLLFHGTENSVDQNIGCFKNIKQ